MVWCNYKNKVGKGGHKKNKERVTQKEWHLWAVNSSITLVTSTNATYNAVNCKIMRTFKSENWWAVAAKWAGNGSTSFFPFVIFRYSCYTSPRCFVPVLAPVKTAPPNILSSGGRHSSLVSSAPTILRPRVRSFVIIITWFHWPAVTSWGLSKFDIMSG